MIGGSRHYENDHHPLIQSGIQMQTGRTSWLLVVTFTLVGASSCSRSFDQVSPRRSTRGMITRADLDDTSYSSTYHAIRSLRPSWLWRRGNATLSNPDPRPIVYLDGVRTGYLGELRLISADDVETIRRLSPSDATTRYGTGHLAGAIDVRTRRGRRPGRQPGPVNG